MSATSTVTTLPLHLLGPADDALLTAQRLGEWITRAPTLEEDVALANIALDQLGAARTLFQLLAAREGAGRTEDDLAYWRGPDEFRNTCLVERERGDFAVTMVRLLLLTTHQHAHWSALCGSTDRDVAALAARCVKEVGYHVDHAAGWVDRLGDGTEESHRRTQTALDAEWAWAAELTDSSGTDPEAIASGAAVDVADLREPVLTRLRAVLHGAGLAEPTEPVGGPARPRGRRGEHTAALAPLLAEMQEVARAHPGATW